MNDFLLNFIRTFGPKGYHSYTECTEIKCGIFQFDNFRTLPNHLVEKLNLVEIVDFDDEREQWLTAYTPNFNA